MCSCSPCSAGLAEELLWCCTGADFVSLSHFPAVLGDEFLPGMPHGTVSFP